MRNFKSKQDGIIAIEFAILVPIFIIIVLAVIEFGMYFLKDQIALNSLGSVSSAIQSNPADPNIAQIAKDSGSTFLGLNTAPNYFCAKSYTDYNTAKSNFCSANDWQTTAPVGLPAGNTYYVALEVAAKKFSLGLASNFLPDVKRNTVLQITPSSRPPVCNGVDKILQVDDSGNFVCEDALKCPTYMIKINNSFCIDSRNRSRTTLISAMSNCANLDTRVGGKSNYSASLCSASQLRIAQRSGATTLSSSNVNLHYDKTDNTCKNSDCWWPYNTGSSGVINGGLGPVNTQNAHYVYRCCIER